MVRTPRTYVLTLWLLMLLAGLAGAECGKKMSCCCEPAVATCEMKAAPATLSPAPTAIQSCECSLENERPKNPSTALIRTSKIDIESALVSLVVVGNPSPRLCSGTVERFDVESLPPPRFELPHPVFPNPPPAAA